MTTEFLRTSSSQIKTFRECRRQWWFKKVLKIRPPAKNQNSLTFGKVLHNVCERYLLADDQGRDEHGDPVDLYPPGWLSAEGDTLTDDEGEEIKTLVQKAIDSGILTRKAKRQVEAEFWHVVSLEPLVLFNGLSDVVLPGEIQDHKSARNTRYLLTEKEDSPRYIGADPQLLHYAKIFQPEGGIVRHNQFIREGLKVQTKKAPVTPEEIEGEWDKVIDDCYEMIDLKLTGFTADEWEKIPTNIESEDCGTGEWCAKYGGCPYLSVCSKEEKPRDLKKRLLRMAHPPTLSPREENDMAKMSLKERIEARKAEKAGKKKTVGELVEDLADKNPCFDEEPEVNPPGSSAAEPEIKEEPKPEALKAEEPAAPPAEEKKPETKPDKKRKMKAPTKAQIKEQLEAAENRIKSLEDMLRRSQELLDAEPEAKPTPRLPIVYLTCIPTSGQHALENSQKVLAALAKADGKTLAEWYALPVYERTAALRRNASAVLEAVITAGKDIFIEFNTGETAALVDALSSKLTVVRPLG